MGLYRKAVVGRVCVLSTVVDSILILAVVVALGCVLSSWKASGGLVYLPEELFGSS